jgi:fumarate hydratase class II
MSDTRKETDSMGEMLVPADSLYGAQTARAIENFPISGWPLPAEFIAAVAMIKWAAALENCRAGKLDEDRSTAIVAAAEEIIDGQFADQFPIDVFQTGSGTSTNMNVNEVLARRALSWGAVTDVHPNDHVNMGQSSNDVIPSALHISTLLAARQSLRPALETLHAALAAKAAEFDSVVKIGRTHLMDAVPIRLGQEFSGYARQMEQGIARLDAACDDLRELAIGGTAVGTGLNTHAEFGDEVCDLLTRRTGETFTVAANRFEATASRDAAVQFSATLRTIAISLSKIASDIRLMGSGPRCGLGELILPATQPGSIIIIPGKVKPVICESVVQVACQVIGCDAAVSAGAMGGVGSILELSVAMPMMASNLLTAVRLLANVSTVFVDKCITGLEANSERCEQLIEQSLAMVTALAPTLGYSAAADLAKEAHTTGQTIRELILSKGLLPEAELNQLLDARKQTGE